MKMEHVFPGMGVGLCPGKDSVVEEGASESTEENRTHNSGLFCVSITAAIGIPKFETGPQKSIPHQHQILQFPIIALNRQKQVLLAHASTSGQVGEVRSNWDANVRVEQT
jgi:hypothetical protein